MSRMYGPNIAPSLRDCPHAPHDALEQCNLHSLTNAAPFQMVWAADQCRSPGWRAHLLCKWKHL